MFDKRKYTRRNDTLLKLWLPNIYVIPHMDQECTPDLLKDLKVYLSIGWQVLGEKIELWYQSSRLFPERS